MTLNSLLSVVGTRINPETTEYQRILNDALDAKNDDLVCWLLRSERDEMTPTYLERGVMCVGQDDIIAKYLSDYEESRSNRNDQVQRTTGYIDTTSTLRKFHSKPSKSNNKIPTNDGSTRHKYIATSSFNISNQRNNDGKSSTPILIDSEEEEEKTIVFDRNNKRRAGDADAPLVVDDWWDY